MVPAKVVPVPANLVVLAAGKAKAVMAEVAEVACSKELAEVWKKLAETLVFRALEVIAEVAEVACSKELAEVWKKLAETLVFRAFEVIAEVLLSCCNE